MDKQAFDSWTKSLATAVSRRGLIRGSIGCGVALLWSEDAAAKRKSAKRVTLCFRKKSVTVSERSVASFMRRGAAIGECAETCPPSQVCEDAGNLVCCPPDVPCADFGGCCPSGKSCSDGGSPAVCCPSSTDVCVLQDLQCCSPDLVCFGGDVGQICCDGEAPCADNGGCCPSGKSCGVPFRGDPVCCADASDRCVHPEGDVNDQEGDCCPTDRICADGETGATVCCSGTCAGGTCQI